MTSIAIYFEAAPGGVRMVQTANTAGIVGRAGRASRGRGKGVIAAFVVEKEQAKKLRHLLNRAWQRDRIGGNTFSILPDRVEQVCRHLATTYGLACYGISLEPSQQARLAAHRLFAGGPKVKRALKPSDIEPAVLDELVAHGIVTKHKRAGETVYRGTERAKTIARMVSTEAVPSRGKPSAVITRPLITDAIVVPDPMVTRELLQGRMDEAAEAGKDPLDVLHDQGYRVSVVNLRELIGGLAAVTEIDEFQRKGAAHFRRVAEQGQLGGARAIDYSVDRVDTSLAKDAGIEAGAAARAEYEAARAALKRQRLTEKTGGPGEARLKVAERMIVAGQSVVEVAAAFGYGRGGAARARITDIARDAARVLAKHFGYLPSRRSPLRAEGDKPTATPDEFRVEIQKKGKKVA